MCKSIKERPPRDTPFAIDGMKQEIEAQQQWRWEETLGATSLQRGKAWGLSAKAKYTGKSETQETLRDTERDFGSSGEGSSRTGGTRLLRPQKGPSSTECWVSQSLAEKLWRKSGAYR
jgi:hypothetical protein